MRRASPGRRPRSWPGGPRRARPASADLEGRGCPGPRSLFPAGRAARRAGSGAGECLDAAPGSACLLGFIETAVDTARLGEASEDEIIGLITAADRAEAAACFLKHAAAAELIRRRPAPGCTLAGPARMPEAYLDSAGDEVKWALAETRPAGDGVLSLAHDLEVKLPGTRALFRDGFLRHSKVQASSPARPCCWTRTRPARPRRWSWAGPGP